MLKKVVNKKVVILASVIVAILVAIYDFELILTLIGLAIMVGLIVMIIASIKNACNELKPKKQGAKK